MDEHAKEKPFRKRRVKRLKRIILFVIGCSILIPIVLSTMSFIHIFKVQSKYNALVELVNKGEDLHKQDDEIAALQDQIVLLEEQLQAIKEKNSQQNEEKEVVVGNKNDKSDKSDKSDKNDKNDKSDTGDKSIAVPKVVKKTVYLTFDDGPSSNTNEILDILNKYNIKATFFVLGKSFDGAKQIYQRIVKEGHSLGMHSYSHDYATIYSSVEEFEKDVKKISEYLYEITGVKPTIYRFPGGSSNTITKIDIHEFINVLNKKGIVHYDWNIMNGDAYNYKVKVNTLIDNVVTGVNKYQTSMVLMHDAASKDNTVESLPKLIETLNKMEVTFLPITEQTEPIQHRYVEE